jgi:pimeloyl-ACP methyl ester carboxylesterase
MNKIFWSTLCILMLATPLGGAAAANYQSAACPFEGAPEIEGLECGILLVPEQRGNPDSRTLGLAVAVLRSTAPDPAPDPVVFLSGGPGGSSVEFLPRRARSAFWDRIREKRDVVFFDQRGTGYSEPEFCPEMNATFNALIYRGLQVEQVQAESVRAAADCREKMLAQGVDLTAYNSAASARDVADLRRALGYPAWNLLGVSYGTRLALATLRDAPDGIRSAILDSAMPPDIAIWADAGDRFDRSLRLAFDQCAESPDCQKAFPEIEEDFYRVITELDKDPLVIAVAESPRFPDGRLVVDGALWAAGMFQGFYDRAFIPVFPLIVRESIRRNEGVMRALAEHLARDPEKVSIGMKYAVTCYENLPFNPPEKLQEDRHRHPRLARWFPHAAPEPAVCEAWHEGRAGEDEFQPVHSTVPVLILAGEFDPITPPGYGRQAARTLPNATFVELPAAGHAVSSSSQCTRDLINAFIDAPGGRLDTTCVDELPAASFVNDVRMNRGVYRAATTLQGGARAFALPALLALVLLATALGWPVAATVRRVRGRAPVGAGPAGQSVAWPLAALASALALVFLVGVVLVIGHTAEVNPYVLVFGMPGHAAWLLVLPWVVALLAAGIVVLAVQAWRQRWWTRAGRIRYTIAAAACAGFVVLVAAWGLM